MTSSDFTMSPTPPTSATPSSEPSGSELITLGGGCFWCLEAVYARVEGVLSVESGYSNGRVKQPSYEAVCTGTTGHAEVVRVRFDPSRLPLAEVLEIFFVMHDPTTLNRQGNDIGTQYRSGIYVHSAGQQAVARTVMADVAAHFDRPLVTEVVPEDNYWPAEAYHQRYYENHPEQGYCSYIISPKLAKLRQKFAARLRRE
jgi:peptide-methionine (S)-S-oxide reductase